MTTYYNVYGTITAVKPGARNWIGWKSPNVITLSTGHSINVNDNEFIDDYESCVFTVGQDMFFTVHGHEIIKGSNNYKLSYVDSKLITKEDSEEIKLLTRNLSQQATNVVTCLRTLNNHDRGQVFKAVGIAVTGTISVTSAIGFVSAGWQVCTGGPVNPWGLAGSGCIAVGSAAYCALLYEQLSSDHQLRADKVKSFNKAQKAYSKMMLKYIPINGTTYESLNPSVNTLIGKLRPIFNITVDSARAFWHNSMKVNTNYAAA